MDKGEKCPLQQHQRKSLVLFIEDKPSHVDKWVFVLNLAKYVWQCFGELNNDFNGELFFFQLELVNITTVVFFCIINYCHIILAYLAKSMHAVNASLLVVATSILISLNTRFRNKLSVQQSVYLSRVAFVFVI